MPVYEYALTALPSTLLTGPMPPIAALADEIGANDETTCERYEIVDRAAREGIVVRKMNAALLKGAAATVTRCAAELRTLQDRPDNRLTAGILQEIIAEAQHATDPAAAAVIAAKTRVESLPFDEIEPWLRQTVSALRNSNESLLIGMAKQHLDLVAERNGRKVDHETASNLVGARAMLERQLPLAPLIAEVLEATISARASDYPSDNIWLEREVDLSAIEKGTPVKIGIWDTGIDPSMFAIAGELGMAIDQSGRRIESLLFPVGDLKEQVPNLISLAKGSMEARLGLRTADALRFQSAISNLKPEEWRRFSEEMNFIFQYCHGTAVASVVTRGNPFALLQSIGFYMAFRQAEMTYSAEICDRRRQFYRDAVDYLRRSGARVVNMSWGLTLREIGKWLEASGNAANTVKRQKDAIHFFRKERQALEAAILSAPDILFIAAAGNDGSDASFAEIVPASLSAPNLLTVGAVDRRGREALFTSVGETVALFANGVEVEGMLPGNRPAIGNSGTSMACPQVTNAAAKVLAMKPSMSAIELRQLLIDTSDIRSRVRLLNARAAFARAEINLN
jgi:hypothetical protein